MSIDLSIITSVYRGGRFLSRYRSRLYEVAKDVKDAGIALEVVMVANDAQPDEADEISRLEHEVGSVLTNLQIVHVPRETLYASWNRGVKAAQGQGIAFWNIDDDRSAAALIEGANLIKQGCELIDFPFDVITKRRLPLGYEAVGSMRIDAYYSDQQREPPRSLQMGTFFIFSQRLFECVGSFDERFHIVGDYEWQVRAQKAKPNVCTGLEVGGRFVIHGDNLSGVNDPRQRAEENIVYWMYNGSFEPAEPTLMYKTWRRFELPEPDSTIADQLWGTQAEKNWTAYKAMTRAKRRRVARREPFALLVNVLRLRPILSRFGVVNAHNAAIIRRR